jgi:hypothetical protein
MENVVANRAFRYRLTVRGTLEALPPYKCPLVRVKNCPPARGMKMTEAERMPMIGAIRGCSTRPILDDVFKKFGIEETQVKVDALIEAMYNPEVFFSSGDMHIDQQYETLIGAFLTGVWKKKETGE